MNIDNLVALVIFFQQRQGLLSTRLFWLIILRLTNSFSKGIMQTFTINYAVDKYFLF